ncbi:MAG: tocopherol cyclase family protein [Bacteroidales bacterium]
MFRRLMNPEVFQGNLKKKHYFEGWYFKHVTRAHKFFSFIPGISLAENDSHAFIQVMDGLTGKTYYLRYPITDFSWHRNSLYIKVGDSVFTDKGILLNIRDKDLTLSGLIEFSNMIKYPRSLLSPGIMGWYSFVPFMECNHGIVSVIHDLSGDVTFDGKSVSLEGGKGYIEKDWGTSFPESWIWIQSNNFDEPGTSFSVSIAKIPWLGRFFIGFISYLCLGKKFYNFCTYNRSRIVKISHDAGRIGITLSNAGNILEVEVIANTFVGLAAPVSGLMTRRIQESFNSEVHVMLSDKDNALIYKGTGVCVGLEVVERIFDYF